LPLPVFQELFFSGAVVADAVVFFCFVFYLRCGCCWAEVASWQGELCISHMCAAFSIVFFTLVKIKT